MPGQLPFDVYVNILQLLPVSARSDDGPKTLAACLKANTLLRAAASLPSLWAPHYHVKYTLCDPVREDARKRTLGTDWKARFFLRSSLDRRAIDALNYIVLERRGRLEHARDVTSQLSYDVWNALEAEAHCKVPEPFATVEQSRIADARETARPGRIRPHALPRRYWARALLGAISRSHAVRVWGAIKTGQGGQSELLEVAMAGLSSFFSRPPMEISWTMEDLAVECRAYLIQNDISVDPDEFNQSEEQLKRVSVGICDFLWGKGFKAAEQIRFHNFDTRFPHWFLTTHKDTIPISLVYVFACIARRLSLSAAAIDFPGRVLAVVSSPYTTVPNIILDVFGSRNQPILSTEGDIPRLLAEAGIGHDSTWHHIQPASTKAMVLRAARNILASFILFPPVNSVCEPDMHAAFYAALIVNLLFMDDRRYLVGLMRHISQFPLDSLAVLHDSLAPVLDEHIRDEVWQSCGKIRETERREAETVTLRSKLTSPPKYFVGLMFQHVKYGYTGYIYGWDSACSTSQILSVNVDLLARGRKQPFYHAFTDNGSTTYVAEENIVPIAKPDSWHRLFHQVPEAARYFEGLAQAGDMARLLPSPELLAEYPEDNTIADAWVRQ